MAAAVESLEADKASLECKLLQAQHDAADAAQQSAALRELICALRGTDGARAREATHALCGAHARALALGARCEELERRAQRAERALAAARAASSSHLQSAPPLRPGTPTRPLAPSAHALPAHRQSGRQPRWSLYPPAAQDLLRTPPR